MIRIQKKLAEENNLKLNLDLHELSERLICGETPEQLQFFYGGENEDVFCESKTILPYPKK